MVSTTLPPTVDTPGLEEVEKEKNGLPPSFFAPTSLDDPTRYTHETCSLSEYVLLPPLSARPSTPEDTLLCRMLESAPWGRGGAGAAAPCACACACMGAGPGAACVARTVRVLPVRIISFSKMAQYSEIRLNSICKNSLFSFQNCTRACV